MPTYASSDLVAFGLIAEAAEGTFEVSAPFPQMLTNGITPDFTSNIITDPTVSGAGEPVDKRTNLRSLSLQTPAQLRYGDLKTMVAAQLRDVFPAEVTIVGSSDIDVVTNGTHNDGSTGPQILGTGIGSTTIFDTFIEYGGVTAVSHPDGGVEGLMLYTTGSAQAANNNPRRIKSCWKNGSNSFIDLFPGYVGGTGTGFGSPVIATAAESLTLRVGTAARNRITGAGVLSYSALWNFADMVTNAGWQNGFGLVANNLGVSWSGKDGMGITLDWLGYGSGELVAADPSSQGIVDTALLFSPMMVAAEDLQTIAIVTATTPTELTSFNVTGFNGDIAGNCAQIDDVSGSSLVTGIRRGSHDPSGSIDWYLANDPRCQVLSQLGSAANNEKGFVDVLTQDSQGNKIVLGWLDNEFTPTGAIPGAGGNTVGGTLQFSGHRLRSPTNKARSFVWQEFAV